MTSRVALSLILLCALPLSAQMPPSPRLVVANAVVWPSNAASTDTNNPSGSVDKPRKTIMNPVPAGTILDLIGAYPTGHMSPNGLVVNGTAAAPVRIRGASPLAPAVISAGWELSGTYATFEGLRWTAGVNLVAPNRDVDVRDSQVVGNGATCLGIGINSYSTAVNSYVTLYRVTSSDHGSLAATYDQDCHGLGIGQRADHIWVTESLFERNSGDGIQINGTATGRASTHHIYVSRSVAAFNKQAGFWTKQASDVVFFRNTSHDHRPSNSSPGNCMGGQYGPERAWWVSNTVWNCDYGIQLASNSGAGDGLQTYFLGNSIHDIRDSLGRFDPANPWQTCALSLMGGTTRTVLYNSLVNVDSGICTTGATTTYEGGDTVSGLRSNGLAVFGVLTPVTPSGTWNTLRLQLNAAYGTTF